jgi:tRNA A37 threonylcarbamoyladenosine dehydratase
MEKKGPHHGWQERTIQLFGRDGFTRLEQSNVLVAGMGGVGSMAAEMICRSGVGRMTIIDGDTIQPGNLNRQIPATHSTLYAGKAAVMGRRLLDINPGLGLTVISEFISGEHIPEILTEPYDYVVDPSLVKVADFADTYSCRLASVLRKRLRKMGVHGGFKVVFSTERVPKEIIVQVEGEPNKRSTAGTSSFIPAIFGCTLASIVVRDLAAAPGGG